MRPDFDASSPAQIQATVIGVVIALGVVLWRNQKPRKLRIELLWIRPILFSLVIAATLFASPAPLTIVSAIVLLLAVAAGGALGWQRGRFMRIDVDPASHALTAKASPIGILFIVAILVLRTALRGAMFEIHSSFGLPATLLTDAMILLLGAMVTVQSLEMWLRARKRLAEARAAGAERLGETQPRPAQTEN